MLKKKSYPGAVKYKRKLYELTLAPVILDGDKVTDGDRGFCQKTAEVQRIVLHSKMNKKLLFETFLHECLHLIEYEEGFEIPHHLIEKLEEPLAKLLLQNFNIEFRKR